jgi:serine phosphatase RsbU (regulator of sigma subunit)
VILSAALPGTLPALSDFYWEEPEIFSSAGSFPVSAYQDGLSVIAWQEAEAAEGRIRISLAVKNPDGPWRIHRALGEGYRFSGTEPSILSITLDRQGRILIAAAASSSQTEILLSEDQGESFEVIRVDSGSESAVAPRIFSRDDGGCLLFVTRGQEQSLSIYYARSDDGRNWTPFEPFVTAAGMQLNFLPTHASLNGREYVAFQSFVGEAEAVPAFQLFLTMSDNGGRSWSAPQRLTDFLDPVMNTHASPDRFDNQRPFLSRQAEGLFLVWERRYGAGSPQIYGAALREDGSLRSPAERINSAEAHCNNPIAFPYQGETTVVWFDNRRGGSRVFLAQRDRLDWQNRELSGTGGDAMFCRPVVSGEDLLLFYQVNARDTSRIYTLAPDTSVFPPRLLADNFIPGRRGRGERVRTRWTVPYDPSGILGFSYLWSRDPDAEPERRLMLSAGTGSLESIANEDGSWYFSIIAQDFAGNWSPPARLEYIRDTTPPPAATIIPPALDERGFLPSNSFSLGWNPPPASDIAGYTWTLDYLGSASPFNALDDAGFLLAARERYPPTTPPAPRIRGSDTMAAFVNQDNGVWRFSVAAVDEVGNLGLSSSLFFRTDKYIPYTSVTHVDASQDEQGVLSVRIIGRGFSQGGLITRIFLDQDGEPPYDREYFLDRGDYRVLSDREIAGLRIEDIDQGRYRVGMDHPRRGRYLTAPLITVDETGTVKFGDYSGPWEPSWKVREWRRFIIDTVLLIMIGIMLFCVVGLFVSIRGIGAVVVEGTALRVEAAALITGDLMPSEQKNRSARLKKRGVGLRIKLASFTIVLVLLVVVMVSAPLYVRMTRTRQETLLQGLWDRSSVLLEGLASSARVYLPAGNVLELGFLPAQSAAVPEARYVTITGYGTGSTIYDDHVWATNDPDIRSKIDTGDFQPGASRLEDRLSPRLELIAGELNDRARAQVGSLSASIAGLTQEGISLALRQDTASVQRREDIQVSIRSMEDRVAQGLAEIGREIGSEPDFSPGILANDGHQGFIFFKPVLYRQGAEDIYFRGLVRLEVSLDSIIEQIAQGQRSLLEMILLVALIALAIGALGALVLSSLIIRPIRKLVSHVELIRDTVDKSKLEGVDIHLASHDELAVLGNTINDMTHGLVKAAQASQDLTIGKEVQKKFIPLELDRDGNKLTSGFKDTKNAQFFGYYEGAKGVSGDYFDYQDLDGRYFAIIKCDVAGKGIPAALIMIQVATMFLNYFKDWKPTAKGMHIEEVVYQINDFIEALGFKGRFAAFTLALFDSLTGLVRFCNAGDNIIHYYDASERRMKTLTLRQTPATGVLPNLLVESKGGYPVQNFTLDNGDILFLYTDGIEEAKRKFRDSAFQEITCAEGPPDSPHDNHVSGQGDEELGPDRVEAIINAVMNKQVYTLRKYHNPEGEVKLNFDFTDCEGTVEEAIMAMVSVEKMFRLYKESGTGEESKILVDRKVDEFLKVHFLQYRNYCLETREYPENNMYMYYTHVNEDAQYDDLTIIGIKRK